MPQSEQAAAPAAARIAAPADAACEPTIELDAIHNPLLGKAVSYLFRVSNGELHIRRNSKASPAEWTFPHSIAQSIVNTGLLLSISVRLPGQKPLKLSVDEDAVQRRQLKRLKAWLNGNLIPPPVTHEPQELKTARLAGVLQVVATAVGSFVLPNLSSSERGIVLLWAGIAAVAVVGLWRRMLWGPIILFGLNILALIEMVALRASLLSFRGLMLVLFLSTYATATRYLMRTRK